MRTLLLFALAATAPALEPEVSSLGWIAGCYEFRPSANFSIEEQWTRPAGETMLGMGRTIKGGKTVFTEFLKISVINGKITYTARIGTKGVTEFPLLKATADEVVFENPAHDFPQRIIYRKQGADVVARIEGIDKGKPRHEDFPYKKVRCE